MVSRSVFRKTLFIASLAVLALSIFAPMGYAQEEHAGDVVTAAQDMSLGAGLRAAGVAIGAGLAVLGGALGTGRAQAAIGAGGTGALAEKPELFGRIFILVALPETVIVLGFVVGVLLWTSL